MWAGDIHYQILKHLPDRYMTMTMMTMTINLFRNIININIVQISLHALLDLFKDIWDDGVLSPGWREATGPSPKT